MMTMTLEWEEGHLKLLDIVAPGTQQQQQQQEEEVHRHHQLKETRLLKQTIFTIQKKVMKGLDSLLILKIDLVQ